MKFGLTEPELNWLFSKVVEPLKANKAKVFLFGSRANGKYKKFSDVDLCYSEDMNNPIASKVIFEIITEAENSKFNYKIDLVNYRELAESYKANIDFEKIEL